MLVKRTQCRKISSDTVVQLTSTFVALNCVTECMYKAGFYDNMTEVFDPDKSGHESGAWINPYKHIVIYRQTVQIQIRHRIMRCLNRLLTVCLQNLQLKFAKNIINTTQHP